MWGELVVRFVVACAFRGRRGGEEEPREVVEVVLVPVLRRHKLPALSR